MTRAFALPSLMALLLPAVAGAQDTPPAAPAEAESEPAADDTTAPTVLHTPLPSAPAGRDVELRAEVTGDWRLAELALRYRRVGGPWQTVPFERGRRGDWRAVVPARDVRAVGFEYFIESRDRTGLVRRHFAGIDAPHPVRVEGQAAEDTEAEQLARYRGHRAELRVDAALVAYGTVAADGIGDGSRDGITDRFSDRYWHGEAEFIWRPLTLLHDFRFGVGVMRAAWPTVDDSPIERGEEPGVNYGFGELNFELHRWFSLGGRLVLGATDQGFTIGFGAVGRLGDIAGTHLAASYEAIGDVGSRTDLRFHWTTVPRVPMAIGIEFTDWPAAASRDAANLSFDLGVEIDDRWTATARIGTASRSGSLDGGVQGGLGVRCAF
ncbi:MAG: hypothetical protein R3F65_16980 [bacterium]